MFTSIDSELSSPVSPSDQPKGDPVYGQPVVDLNDPLENADKTNEPRTGSHLTESGDSVRERLSEKDTSIPSGSPNEGGDRTDSPVATYSDDKSVENSNSDNNNAKNSLEKDGRQNALREIDKDDSKDVKSQNTGSDQDTGKGQGDSTENCDDSSQAILLEGANQVGDSTFYVPLSKTSGENVAEDASPSEKRSSLLSVVDWDWSITFEQFVASMLTEPSLVKYFEHRIVLSETVDRFRNRRLLERTSSLSESPSAV